MSNLTIKQRLQKNFMSDKKRYGIKRTRRYRLNYILGILLLIIGAIILSYYEWINELEDYKMMFVGLGIAWFGLLIVYGNDIDVLKSRIRELGGDILHQEKK